MTIDYQKFPISNFRIGYDEAVEPWLLPKDAYQVMINAHLYRGVIEKIEGYNLYANMTNRIVQSLGTPDGMTKSFTITLAHQPSSTNFFAFGEIIVGTSAETFMYQSDASNTLINLVGSAGGSGTVNLTTKAVTIIFNTAPPSGTYSTIFFVYDYDVTTNAIMGIKQYFTNVGGQQIMIFDTKRVGIITPLLGTALQLQEMCPYSVEEIPHDYLQSAIFTGDDMTLTFSGTLDAKSFLPGSVVILQFTSAGVSVAGSIKDNSFGGLTGSFGAVTVTGSINYSTGAYTVTFSVAPTAGNVFDATVDLYGDLFTGDFTNFFSVTNYQYYAFFTNYVDPIFYYDGSFIHYLNTILAAPTRITAASGKPNNLGITTCLHVTTNRERLLLLSPTLSVGGKQVSAIYRSTTGQPLDFTNGGILIAPTSEPIRTFSYINTDLVVRFASSERIFKYTADNFAPFRWDTTNSLWDCDAPYSAINYDAYFTSVGKPAIVASDGVNVTRADEQIPDFTDPTVLSQQTPMPFMSQTSIAQCYGERFDDEKEGWLCFNSSPVDENGPTASDNILAFNYLDDTYAVYSFPFSCLGFGTIINVQTWGTITTYWENMEYNWDSYQIQKKSLVDLAGDQFDRVFALRQGNTLTNVDGSVSPVLMNVITKNFNPFIDDGQLARLGYIDLFVSAYNTTTLRVQFFVNDQLYVDGNGVIQGYYQETLLQFNTTDAMSPNTNQTKVWKRIYVGAVGKIHTIRFYQNIDDFGETNEQPVYIHGMILYMKPAGRIFN